MSEAEDAAEDGKRCVWLTSMCFSTRRQICTTATWFRCFASRMQGSSRTELGNWTRASGVMVVGPGARSEPTRSARHVGHADAGMVVA